MLGKSVVLFVVLDALALGLVPGVAFAATRTTSISVTATVVAGCQVSPATTAAGTAPSGAAGLNAPISMDCSLPVAYQVTISGSPRTGFGRLGPTVPEFADLPRYARASDLDSLQPQGRSIDSAGEFEYGPVSSGSTTGSVEGERCTAYGAGDGTVTVTIAF